MKKTKFLSVAIVVLFIASFIISCNQEIKRCVVSFKDGGALVKQIIVNEGDIINEVDIPKLSEEGKAFDGWYLGEEKFNFKEQIKTDITLEAKWSDSYYTVSFDTDGGSRVDSIRVKHGGTITFPTDPTKEGFSFDGWYLNEEKFDINTIIKSDIELIAKWIHDKHVFEDNVCTICKGTQCGEDVVFFFDENTKTLTLKGTGSTFDYEILDEKMGTISPRPWDDIFLEIENIEVENGITKIGDMSFAYFSNEEPYLSKIKTVELPSTLKEIGLYAFSASSIENLVIPDGVTSIGNGAFAGCGILEEITIPATINTIGYDVFDESYKVELVKYLGTEEEWVNIDWGFDVTDYNVYFQNENKFLLINCFHGNGKIIAQYLTQYGKEQEKIVVPDYVKEIYESTFKGSKATNIYIPDSVEMIQDNTFSMFDKTTTIKIDVSEDRYHEIFKGDVSKTNVILEDGKPPKFNISMQNSNITFVGLNEIDETMISITIPSYVEKIAKDAFVNALNLTEIHIDKTEEEFHQMYPYEMSSSITVYLKDNEPMKFNISYNNGTWNLENLTDAGSSLEGELVIPNYINNIADGIDNIKASSIVFPENITNIKIKNCTNLQSLTINNTNIDSFIIYARDISGCGKLKEIKYAGKISDWEHIYDSEITSGQEIIVHCSDGDITSYI